MDMVSDFAEIASYNQLQFATSTICAAV